MIQKKFAETEAAISLPWDKYGKVGEDDPIISMSILMDWCITSGKYNTYCGKYNKGLKKKAICAHLAREMNEVSRVVRTANSVKRKISYIEGSWKKAHDWAGATSKCVKENEGI